MWWCALLPETCGPCPIDAAGLALWALQFTPRVAQVEAAVVMEVSASLRLFGGAAALAGRVREGAAVFGAVRLAWGPNSLAALALARTGQAWVDGRTLADQLDGLPLQALAAAAPHRAALGRMGCTSLGALRRLPRAGVARRFDAGLLEALDRLYGQQAEAHEWLRVPEHFDARLELAYRVDTAPALLAGAQHLLQALAGWLSARQVGITAFTLHWAHDALRSRAAGEGDSVTVRTAEITRDPVHLGRLLAEHLGQTTLAAPVGDLRLVAHECQPLPGASASWLPEDATDGEPLPRTLERLAIRLGAGRVVRPVLREDHRPERMTDWVPANRPLGAAPRGDAPSGPQPGFLRPEPLRLLVLNHRPHYGGELQLLLGPQRVEAGWWDRDEARGEHGHTARDYWVARSPQAGVLWVFQTRDAEPAWYLHGFFA
ncbi:Y-family DNA polymerase [Hydrogenophaga electricum]|uniref:DNA polymerase n=1 Tax=Hydrogenophaga electricum TaxID=1230953 RepID=A0ABQ6C6C0_9BURK|nr:DNA polymerase Y family protein [Hydrogenophaga electricum]GLS15853.1 DNA polymerase [Hydrogenophaga electricum]